jgi:hypothetical protein
MFSGSQRTIAAARSSTSRELLVNMSDLPRSKKFRFKSTPRNSKAAAGLEKLNSSHHRHKRRKFSPLTDDNPTAYDDSVHSLPQETAFRESLFDALGDDEGAAFWESVYGQPIHTYLNTYTDQETGALERMTDEGYAQYVRHQMWSKSREGIEAEREARRREEKAEEQTEAKERARKSQGRTSYNRDDHTFDFEIEQSLRRGKERKEKRRWRTLWEGYLKKSADLQNLVKEKPVGDLPQVSLLDDIAWPVESGRWKDLTPKEIEKFITNGTANSNQDIYPDIALMSALKLERLRWHPDKVQQRYGSLGIDEQTMKGVTAVFQVLDRMWNEQRSRS